MRRGGYSRKMWWVVVPCSRKKSKQVAESRMEIEEILKMKLATITEEEPAETIDHHQENGGIPSTTATKKKKKKKNRLMKKMSKNRLIKVNMRRIFVPHFSLKESYVIFMAGLACKAGLHGLPRC